MTRTEYLCDRCGVVIDRDRNLLRVEAGPLRRNQPEIDLCGPCGAALISWMEGGKRQDMATQEGDPGLPSRQSYSQL